MVNRNLIRSLDLSEEEWQQELTEALESAPPEDLEWGTQEVAVNQIVQGRVLRTEGDVVLVDVGYKSEGIIFRSEWEEGEELPKPGQMIKVLIEDVEDIHGLVDDSRGMITLSKRKAEKIEAWMSVMDSVHEGDVVTGVATRKIKGGLLVDIGVPVFLPASQVDIRRPADIGDYIGRTIHVAGAEDRRSAAQHRRQPPGPDRGRAGGKEGPTARRAGSRPSPQGRGQEHRRLRRVRRPGRDRRPAAHHRHELGPHQPSLRDGRHRPGNRSPDPAHRLREGEDRPGPEAEVAQPVGERARQLPHRHGRSRARWST